MLKLKRTAYITRIIVIVIVFFSIFSCSDKKAEAEEELLITYLENHKIEIEPFADGLYYIPYNDTSEVIPNFTSHSKGDSLILVYKGYLLSDTTVVFTEKNEEEPGVYVYKIDDVLEGFEEGMGYIEKGDSAKLIIPSKLAYGKERVGLIKPYSTLIFEIKVINVR